MKLKKFDIEKILPHRKPMLLVDNAEILSKESIKASVYIDSSWDIFKGHFPNSPILPGVYIVEAMAQASALLILSTFDNKNVLPLFFNISKMRFLRPVLPNQTLEVYATLKDTAENGIYDFKVKATVEEKRVAVGEISLVVK